jgi:DNA-binding response OmpR family regulator
MKSILLVNNDVIATEALHRVLCRLGFHVEVATSHISARSKALEPLFDLILMEFNLEFDDPSSSKRLSEDTACWCGTGLIRELRSSGVRLPILVLEIEENPLHETSSLDAGADDYIPKRDQWSTLLSRLYSHLRRRDWDLGWSSHADRRVAVGRYMMDRDSSVLAIDDRPMLLTTREFRLLEKLAGNPERIVSQTELLDEVWGNDIRRSPKALAAAIKRLRIKAEKHGLPDFIEKARGRGYKLGATVLSRSRSLSSSDNHL